MGSEIKSIATYKLPSSLMVTSDCFGKRVKVKIGKIYAIMRLPELSWQGEEPKISMPLHEPDLSRCISHYSDAQKKIDFWGSARSWHPKKKEVREAWVSAVILELALDSTRVTYSKYLYGRGHPEGSEVKALFDSIDGWFQLVQTWTEVALDQETDPQLRLPRVTTSGRGLSIFTVDDKVVSLPASANNLNVNLISYQAISLPLLKKIVSRANRKKQPLDEHLLLSDARREYRRGLYKKAVIEAATATEIALADHNNRITQVGVSTTRPPTLGWYVKQPRIVASVGIPTNTMQDLVAVRNNAIHQNITPTKLKAGNAVRLAEQIVNTVRPPGI